ncbi:thermonuclease family protein [Priestia aryabhattai]|uniref:thermonuclease family protein n=1 Tax=Priestia aryabhattai TaxID=412384 RepID=UPI001C8DC5BF|nr:thermonuclease family protein [Priestia aryabhattai]MBY0077976.1 thermonuclease family protein [Priestia aryabhattai]
MRIHVVRVLDGDTIEGEFFKKILEVEVRFKVHFRFMGIDAPEKKGETKPLGLASMEYLKQRIEGKKVKVKVLDKDKYGRWLAYVFFEGVNINDELVEKGYAIYRTY